MTDPHRRPRRHVRRAAAIAAAVLAAGVAAGCGSDDEAEDAKAPAEQAANASFELSLGVLAPLTGDLSPFGPSAVKSVKLSVEQATKALEAAGADVKITMKEADTESKPQAAQQAARKLVSGGANCLLGPYASGESIPVAKSISRRRQIPTISPSATSAELTSLEDDGYFSRTAPSDNLQTVALADLMEEALGDTTAKVSVAARNDSYGEGFATGFKEEWEKRGGTVVGPLLYDPEQPSYNSEARQIVGGGAEAVVVADFPETWVKMGAALLRTGKWDTDRVFTTDGLAAATIPEGIPPKSLEGIRGTRAGTPESGEAAQAFDRIYKEAGGIDRYTYDAQLFDAAALCILASVAAGSNDGEAIRDQIGPVSSAPGTKYTFLELEQAIRDLRAGKDIDFDGASGPIDLDENGDPTAATYEQWQYVSGKLEVKSSSEVKASGG